MTDLFKAETPPADSLNDKSGADALAELVGEGKKFATVEDLAKGKLQSDAFITRLEQENAGIREDLTKRATIEEFMDKIKPQESPAPVTPVSEPMKQEPPQAQAAEQGMTPEEIRAAIEEQINKDKEQSQAQRNLAQVQEELQKAWGPQYSHMLRDKAKELGVNEEYLQSLAASQPQVFLATVGAHVKTPTVGNVAPPASSQTTTFENGTVGKKNFKHFSKMRKENPSEYWSKSTQNEMHRLAGEMGSSFYE